MINLQIMAMLLHLYVESHRQEDEVQTHIHITRWSSSSHASQPTTKFMEKTENLFPFAKLCIISLSPTIL